MGYDDLNCCYCSNVCGASAKNWEHLSLSIDTGYCFDYGATAYTLDTGEELYDASKLVNENYYTCEHCGRRVSEDCGCWIDGCFYCDNCCGCCDYCGECHPVNEMIETYNGDNVCRDCLYRHYAYCEDIDDYYPLDYCYYSEIDGYYYYDSDNAPHDDEDDESDGEDDEERERIL